MVYYCIEPNSQGFADLTLKCAHEIATSILTSGYFAKNNHASVTRLNFFDAQQSENNYISGGGREGGYK